MSGFKQMIVPALVAVAVTALVFRYVAPVRNFALKS